MKKIKQISKKRKLLNAVLLLIAGLVVICVGAFFIYASIYYKADESAVAIYQNATNIQKEDNLLILSTNEPSDTGLIFYPGAKVEAIAYLPILEQLCQKGITCVLVKMPFNMAIFNTNAADGVEELLPSVKNWYIGGHSMGGAMASSYMASHMDSMNGLILLGAYIYKEVPPSKALTIYGTFNANLEAYINYTDNIVIIEGGNHAQFGNYGKQKGDPEATISAAEQQKQAVDAIADFMGLE